MLTIILLFIYAAIGIITFANEALTDQGIWHALACGVIWPVFLARAIYKIITNL
jgi:hypothetical protein